MKLASIALAALALTGCSVAPTVTYEAAIGANVTKYMPWSDGRDGGVAGPTDMVRFTVRHDISPVSFCAASHISHLSSGWPFNAKTEDWLDIVECGVKFKSR